MAFNFNWFIKITRSFGSGFQIQSCKARSKTDHDWCRSEQTFLPDQIKEHVGFELATQLFIAYSCFFSIVSIMFILIMSVALMAWPSRNPDTYSYSYSYAEATSIAACCHFWGHADPWFFPFFSIFWLKPLLVVTSWVENSIVPFEISIASLLCWASFRSTVRSTQGNKSSQPCCSSQPMIAPGSSQFVCI